MSADMYADSHERYYKDAEFHAAVDLLYYMALKYGYTPGELKQIAFMAALKAEQYATVVQSRIVRPT